MDKTPRLNEIHHAEALDYCRSLPDASVDLALTSPPYFRLRDYGTDKQIGQEFTVKEYLGRLLEVTREIRRALKPGGSLFLNLGDTYASSKCRPRRKRRCRSSAPVLRPVSPVAAKSLMGVPMRLALKMMDEQGWILRNDIIWAKPNPKPNSVMDRFNNSFEHVFFFVKEPAYYFDLDAIRESYSPQTIERLKRAASGKEVGRKRDPFRGAEDPNAILSNMAESWKKGTLRGKIPLDVWALRAGQFKGDHFATFPEGLCRQPILACCPPGGVVLDPFMGSGTTAIAARRLGRNFLGCDLNPDYVRIGAARLEKLGLEISPGIVYGTGERRVSC